MGSARNSPEELLKRKLAAAKAARGYSWDDLAEIMTVCGMPISSGSLMAKSSRGAFKASELAVLMRALGLRFIDLSDLEIPGIDTAISMVEARKQKAAK